MEGEQGKEFLRSLSSLYEKGKYSDFKILCGDKEYQVHKAIVCPRSSFFTAACDGRFIEGQTGVVDLQEDDPEAVDMMVYWFYHLDYPKANENTSASQNGGSSPFVASPSPAKFNPNQGLYSGVNTAPGPFMGGRTNVALPFRNSGAQFGSYNSNTSSSASFTFGSVVNAAGSTVTASLPFGAPSPTEETLIIHAKVYALAEKYDLGALKSLALEKFKKSIATQWNSTEFLEAAEVIFTSTLETDRALRDVVINTFINRRSLLQTPSAKAVIKRVENLAYEILIRIG